MLAFFDVPKKGSMLLCELVFPSGEEWAASSETLPLQAILVSTDDRELASSKKVILFWDQGFSFFFCVCCLIASYLSGITNSNEFRVPTASFATNHIQMEECSCPFDDPGVREKYAERSGWVHKVAQNWTFDCSDYDLQIKRDLAPWHNYNAAKLTASAFDWAYYMTKSAYHFGNCFFGSRMSKLA